ncbi:MAG TPA: amidohydrolase family protein, partial [Gemmatimonadaceae bacterium]
TEPAWSPDGTRIAWASDRGGQLLDLWIHDLRTGEQRRLTRLPTSAMGPAWSPDGRRIAFLDVDGVWRRANVSVVDVETGVITRVHDSMFGPGTPTWSPDGRLIAVAAVHAYSSRFREGTNQILTMPADGRGGETWRMPVRHLSIDSRVGAGPVWSPDGTKMAIVYEGLLHLVPVSAAGEPLGPPRRLTSEMAHAPTWTADSRTILYQSMDRLRTVDVETGAVRDVPLELRYTPAIPTGHVVVHAGRLLDMTSPAVKTDMDVVIEGNRITAVAAHAAATHANARVIDASGRTVMPGLTEYHTHLQKDLGEAHHRAYLAFGVTTVRSPGNTPYEAIEDREAIEAGVRPGPRIFTAGYLMEWNRVYYKMAVAVSSWPHLEMELERARILGHDIVKSYVRMPDLQQRRMREFAHANGMTISSHEVYPAALSGLDGTEHTTGTSRRGYSPKVTTLQHSYADVAALWGATGMTFTPTLALGGSTLRRMLATDTTLRSDRRFSLYPGWLRSQVTGGGRGGRGGRAGAGGAGRGAAPTDGLGPLGDMILRAHRAGARIVTGTDTPNAANVHAELQALVLAGLTPFEALQASTVTPARALGLEAGTIEPGKLADLIVHDGNPLQDILATTRVRTVIANGHVYDVSELLRAGSP